MITASLINTIYVAITLTVIRFQIVIIKVV